MVKVLSVFEKNLSRATSWLKSIPARTWGLIALAFITIIVPGVIFTNLADEVHENETLAFDSAILESVHKHTSPGLDPVMKLITEFGGPLLLPIVALILTAILIYRRELRHAFILFTGVVGASIINIILKSIFRRDRPQLWDWIVSESGTSFPSGHAMASSALALSLMVIFWRTKWRWLAVGTGIVYILLIAFSRIYLGVHYPTDIIASWLISVAWVSAVTWIVYSLRRSPRKAAS